MQDRTILYVLKFWGSELKILGGKKNSHLDDRVVEAWDRAEQLGVGSGATQGGVSSDADAMLLAEFDERITLEVGVHLDLVYGRLYLGVGQAISGEEDAIVAAKEQL